MNKVKEKILRRPGINLLDIANDLETTTATVQNAVKFYTNSDLAKEIRSRYRAQLKAELEFLDDMEKSYSEE